MDELFNLEFSEKEQCFRHEKTEEDSEDGFILLKYSCSNQHKLIFEAFINRKSPRHLTNKYVIKQFIQLEWFIFKLSENEIKINK